MTTTSRLTPLFLPQVDEMLLRLYEPIIWRSLKVANPMGRLQGTAFIVFTQLSPYEL